MRKALVIGINNYPNAQLQGCINDASAFATIIEKHADGSPNFSVVLETGTPTKSKLKEAISNLFAGDGDVALLYFSGHGVLNVIGGYIMTPDYQKYDEGVSMDEILRMANASKIKDKIIILDCCRSGAFGSPSLSDHATTQISEGVTILTACRDSESALEVNGHGVFTSLLIDALQGGAGDLRGEITPGAVYTYIDQALGPWDQRPIFKTNVTRFTSVRSVVPPIAPETLRKIIDYFPMPQDEFKLDPSYEFTNEKIAIPENVAILKDLQKFARVNLVVPVGAEHMYFAAQESRSCKLTALGYRYWRLVKEGRV
jgi:hypothetical protein